MPLHVLNQWLVVKLLQFKEVMENPSLFGSAIGALQYLTNTRLDISFLVNKLSQFLNKPTVMHWQSLKQILRYLKGSLNYSLQIKLAHFLLLNGYSDAESKVN